MKQDRSHQHQKTPDAPRASYVLACVLLSLSACSTFNKMLALDNATQKQAPIHNPFLDYQLNQGKSRDDHIVLRTKKGDRAIEVELPGGSQGISDLVVPVSPLFPDQGGRAPASSDVDDRYLNRDLSSSDRAIVRTFPQSLPENEAKRKEIEAQLGLMGSDDSTPDVDRSYLAAVDHIKQLFRAGRYEAALMELDDVLRIYPTDPKLHEMRGTLFDRLGRWQLAMEAWNQSLRFDPNNESLKRYIERRKQKRSLASP